MLAETVLLRDYKLVFRFGCRVLDCPAKTCTIFLDRTDKEVKDFIRNIKQRCGANHFTKPVKQCSFCNTIYELEVETCIYCEPKARRKAELFIRKEELERQLRHEKGQVNRNILENHIKQIELELT
jgi:hypothetical protein